MITASDTATPAAALERVRVAASRLYDAECALHVAHQTHVDQWITAASDRLHEAAAEHLAALQIAALSSAQPLGSSVTVPWRDCRTRVLA